MTARKAGEFTAKIMAHLMAVALTILLVYLILCGYVLSSVVCVMFVWSLYRAETFRFWEDFEETEKKEEVKNDGKKKI